MRASNGDTDRRWRIGAERVVGVGSFHKSLPHNMYGEVTRAAFRKLVRATRGNGTGFKTVPKGQERVAGKGVAALTNPQAGLAADRLTHHPAFYSMPPSPTVTSLSTAAEMTELYWMALLRDKPFNQFPGDADILAAIPELDARFGDATNDTGDSGHLRPGADLPGSSATRAPLDEQNVFRLGFHDDHLGPMVSQFFIRPIQFGTQTIDQMQRPYKSVDNFLTTYDDWWKAQDSGQDANAQPYPRSNEHDASNFEASSRYISTMRDLARFVNKDALHQAYFNAALLLLSGGAKWNQGNPYGDFGTLGMREAGFGVLGGPHILALVSEVATRALKVVWNQKWQVHLRLRPEAYGGLVHVQNIGVNGNTRAYGLPSWVHITDAAQRVHNQYQSFLLPMAFTAGSPTHPAYGAGHATVAGACVTVLKAYFQMYKKVGNADKSILLNTLKERTEPFGMGATMKSYVSGEQGGTWDRFELPLAVSDSLTIEGELNKLAQNVAMGRTMGGVHWRSDNTRSLMLGEVLAAEILADITTDVNEKPTFEFRTFARDAQGKPRKVHIESGRIFVNGVMVAPGSSFV